MKTFEAFLKRIVALTDAAAAVFLLVITVLTFTAVLMRYVLAMPFPGSFDVSRLLLGVSIFWGIAVGAYRREHISVDIFWQMMPARAQRLVDLFGDLVFAVFIGIFSYMLYQQVARVMASQQTTFELSIPIWPFYGVAWLGIVLCFVVLLARIAHAVFIGPVSHRNSQS
jgi:TRAP-type C4-dicarboxylate transport system permease small subunit